MAKTKPVPKPEGNPLKAWFNQYPRPMLQREFAERVGISQSFLTSLLSDTPPWPARETLRRIAEVTGGAVTADMWVELADPPPRRLIRAA